MLLIQWEGLSLSGHTADTISHVTVRSYCWYNEKSCHCQVILLIQWEVLTLSGNNANKKKGLALSSHTNLYCICQWTGVLHHPQPPPQSSRFNLPARLTQGSRHPKSAFPHRRCRFPGSTLSWWQTLDPPSLRPCQQQHITRTELCHIMSFSSPSPWPSQQHLTTRRVITVRQLTFKCTTGKKQNMLFISPKHTSLTQSIMRMTF